ncbi:SMAD/FHA domain-containing protein [Xylariaceae sp. FL0016]|nr:SMAD/FHA domain-containing protein [Xylariaceae sp. FL0016]
MHSGSSSPDRSRRPRDDSKDRSSRTSRHDDKYRRHGSKRDRSRDRRHRRSRSPNYSRHPRSGSRDRGRDRNRDKDKDRNRDQEHRRHRSRDYDKHEGSTSQRHRGRDSKAYDDQDRGDKQVIRRNGPLPSQADSFALAEGEEPPKPKEKPNYGSTGALAAASNSVTQADGSTIVLKYHEPPEARKPSPKDQWKLFVFKSEEILDTVPLSSRTCWLIGRELAVVDMAAEHPSISKQHAVIQFRYLEKRNEYGDKIGKVKPYLIDLESANGTMLNSKKVPDSRYLELRDKDMIQFGQSTREYVLMLAPKD